MPPHIRQNYNPDSEAGVNKQINMELYASYTYLSMAFYYDRSDVALPGAYKFFLKASQEERENALKLLKYQNERGGDVVFKDITMPTKSSWGSLLDGVNDALDLQKAINQAYLDLHAIAATHIDPQMCDFIEENFLTEKVKAIQKLGDHWTQLGRVGNGLGEYIYDKDSIIGDRECT